MKKFLATLFAAALAVSVSAGAFAATELTESPTKGKAEGEYTIDVQGRYQAGTSTAGDVISADIAWEGLTFTYTAESKGTWNASTHSYNGGTDGAWSTNKGEITVTNHSNVGLEADFTFTGKNGITGTFTKNSVSVESADNAKYQTPVDGVYPAPSASTKFGIDSTSKAISTDGSIGTITVNLAKEVWTEVGTEAELLSAIANGGNIRVKNDITLDDIVLINNGKTMKIDLNNHTMSNSEGHLVLEVSSNSSVTILNGTLSSTSSGALFQRSGTLYVENCTLTGSTNSFNNNNGDATFKDCTFNGYCALQENGNIELLGTNTFNKGINASDKGIAVTNVSTGTVLCHFNPTGFVNLGKITDNGDGTWTVSANS